MKNRFILKIFISYIASTLLAAFIYFLIFRINTANFYIAEEFNERVNGRYIECTQDVLYNIPDRSKIPFSIAEFNQTIKSLNDTLYQTYCKIDKLVVYKLSLEETYSSISSIFNQTREEDIEEFRKSSVSIIRDSIDRLEATIQACLMNGVPEEQLILSGEYVNLASLKYKYARKNVDVSDYILRNFGLFGDRDVLDSLNNISQAILNISDMIWDLESQKREYFRMYEEVTNSFHYQRIEKVGFRDFLYFSLLIATSNSFGDIVPNSPVARLLVSLQLVIGIICLGCILNELFKIMGNR